MSVPAGRTRKADSPYREQAAALAARLRHARVDVGYTQEQLAVQAGVAVSTLRKIEDGRVVEPGYFTVLALATALGLGLSDLAEASPTRANTRIPSNDRQPK